MVVRYETAGEWEIFIPDEDSILVYHIHDEAGWKINYVVNSNFECRECGEEAPPGIIFRAKTVGLADEV